MQVKSGASSGFCGKQGLQGRDNAGPWGREVPGPEVGMRLGLWHGGETRPGREVTANSAG